MNLCESILFDIIINLVVNESQGLRSKEKDPEKKSAKLWVKVNTKEEVKVTIEVSTDNITKVTTGNTIDDTTENTTGNTTELKYTTEVKDIKKGVLIVSMFTITTFILVFLVAVYITSEQGRERAKTTNTLQTLLTEIVHKTIKCGLNI